MISKTKVSFFEKEKYYQKIPKKASHNYDQNTQKLGIVNKIMTQDTIFIVSS